MGELIEFIFEYSWVWMMVIIIYKTHKWYSKSDKTEELLILKLMGYYILGGFSFNINGIMPFPIIIPIGILVYVLTIQDKEKRNKDVKDKIARFAFLMLCIGTLCSFINYYLEYRVVYIKDTDMKMESLYEDYVHIKNKMDIEEELIIYDFSASIEPSGKIETIGYMLKGIEKDYRISYSYFDEEDMSLRVEPIKNEINSEYNDMYIGTNSNYYSEYKISAGEILQHISNMEFSNNKFKDKNIVGNSIDYDSDFGNDPSKFYENQSVYYVDKNNNYSYEEITKDMLPVSGIIIRNSYMEEVEENFIQGIHKDIYVINPIFE